MTTWSIEKPVLQRAAPLLICCSYICLDKLLERTAGITIKCPVVAGNALRYLLHDAGSRKIIWNGSPLCSNQLEGQKFFLTCGNSPRAESLIRNSNGTVTKSYEQHVILLVDGFSDNNVELDWISVLIQIRMKKRLIGICVGCYCWKASSSYRH